MKLSSVVVIAEIKGFSKLASDLARGLESVAITPERVRASTIVIVNEIGDLCAQICRPTSSAHIGGDTWFFSFASLDLAARFSCTFLQHCRHQVTEKGLFFLKPSLAMAFGEPKLLNARFLDNESIGAYRLADGGKPFSLLVHENAIASVHSLGWLPMGDALPGEGEKPASSLAEWQNATVPGSGKNLPFLEVALPNLLLDSEVIYSRTAEEAISNIVRQQDTAKTVFAFGGPVPLDVPYYRSYLKETIHALRREGGPAFTVLSYIPHNEAALSYSWIEMCRGLSIEFPQRFVFAAFSIPEGQLRPFSFQIFDQTTVHLGLRSYSPQTGTPTMSSAIMLRNRNIAERFHNEFLENFRKIGLLDDLAYGHIVSALSGLTPQIKREAIKQVRTLMDDQ